MTPLLSIPDVAELLNVSVGTVRNMIKREGLPAVAVLSQKQRTTYRIDPDELEAFVARRRVNV